MLNRIPKQIYLDPGIVETYQRYVDQTNQTFSAVVGESLEQNIKKLEKKVAAAELEHQRKYQ